MSRKFFKTIVLTSSLLVSSSPQQVPSGSLQWDIYDTLQSPLPSTTPLGSNATTEKNIQEVFSDSITNDDVTSETMTNKSNESTVGVLTHKSLEPIIEQPSPGDITQRRENNRKYNTTLSSPATPQKDISSPLAQTQKEKVGSSEITIETIEKESISKQKINNKFYFSRVVDSIVSPTSKVNFEVDYMKREIHTLLDHCYRIENKRLIFTPPSQEKKEAITSLMDSIRQHIKDKNNIFVKIFLGKKALRNFITEEIDTIYNVLVEENKLQYKGGEEQFKQDFHSIIDIYK